MQRMDTLENVISKEGFKVENEEAVYEKEGEVMIKVCFSSQSEMTVHLMKRSDETIRIVK